MSHTVTIKIEVRDLTALQAACRRLNLPAPVEGKHELFEGEVQGHAVSLKDWSYPVVFDLKTGKGYYKYEPGSRAALPDPEVEKLIDETLARLGRKKRVVTDDEILERMMYPMINEGAKILAEGIAARPSDIDVVWLYGYGWPIYRGGPMFWADTEGAKKIVEGLEKHGFKVAELLKSNAESGSRFK